MPEPGESRVGALSALLGAESNAVSSAAQVSMAVVGVIGAYLPVSLFAVYQGYGSPVIGYLPVPVVILIFFQLIHAAATERREDTIALLERELAAEGGVAGALAAGQLGSGARRQIVDARAIAAGRGDRWLSRAVAATVPSLGLPLVGFVYTWFLCLEAARLNPDYPGRTWTVIAPILVNLVLWTVFVDSAISHYAPRYRFNIWVPTAAFAGIWLQAHQPGDGTPVALYFSVLSAALIGVVAILRPLRWPLLRVIERAAIAGILTSALGFWAMIFPAHRFGDSEAAVWANVAMHVVAPLAAVLGVWSRRTPLQPLRASTIAALLLLPLAWLGVVLACHAALGTPLPYSFLDPARGGWGMAAATVAVTAVVFLAVGGAERIARLFSRG